MIWKKTGNKPKELDIAPPEIFTDLWYWFLELNSGRTSNGFGANAISYSEIKAWSELTGRSLEPYQVSILKQLDRIVLNGR